MASIHALLALTSIRSRMSDIRKSWLFSLSSRSSDASTRHSYAVVARERRQSKRRGTSFSDDLVSNSICRQTATAAMLAGSGDQMLACIHTWTLSTRDCQRVTMIGTNHSSSEHRRWRISSVLRYFSLIHNQCKISAATYRVSVSVRQYHSIKLKSSTTVHISAVQAHRWPATMHTSWLLGTKRTAIAYCYSCRCLPSPSIMQHLH